MVINVLVFDDQEAIRTLFETILKNYENIKTNYAETKKQALEIIKNNSNIEIAILDTIGEEETDGPEIAKQLYNTNPKAYIIAMSGTTDAKDIWQENFKNEFKFLSKPIDVNNFYSLLDNYLNNR